MEERSDDERSEIEFFNLFFCTHERILLMREEEEETERKKI